MFGIGFFEVILLCIIALVVLGPERLPEAIRCSVLWMGRLKQRLESMRKEIEQEINVAEVRQVLHNEHVLRTLKETGYDEQGGRSDSPKKRQPENA